MSANAWGIAAKRAPAIRDATRSGGLACHRAPSSLQHSSSQASDEMSYFVHLGYRLHPANAISQLMFTDLV